MLFGVRQIYKTTLSGIRVKHDSEVLARRVGVRWKMMSLDVCHSIYRVTVESMFDCVLRNTHRLSTLWKMSSANHSGKYLIVSRLR